MSPKIFLHIGAMKTGTTYLQRLMQANAVSLERAGCYFPVEGGWSKQVTAVRDVMGTIRDPRVRRRESNPWREMTDRMLAYDGAASVMSMEFLSFAKPAAIERIASTFEDAELHAVFTVRDAVNVIPAQWQTAVQSGHTATWPDFAEQVIAGRDAAGSDGQLVINRAQNVRRILRRWLPAVPPERFHVVTVPPSGAPKSLLWERFASVLGVDPAACSAPARRSNASLGQASAGLVRLIFLELGKLSRTQRQTIKNQLVNESLSERARFEPRARTNQALREFAARKNRRMRSAITAAGVDVVGDLDDLPALPPPPGDAPDEIALPEPAEILAAADHALPAMRAIVDKRANELRKRDLQVDDLLDRLPGVGDHDGDDRLDAAVKELAGIIRVAIEMRDRLIDHADAIGA